MVLDYVVTWSWEIKMPTFIVFSADNIAIDNNRGLTCVALDLSINSVGHIRVFWAVSQAV